jgi:peptidoglycan/LPS O-acetylase OafA/YrhL
MTYGTRTKSSSTNATRVDFLDGIRGWASFAVLLSHILMCFLVLTTPFLRYDRERLTADISSNNYLDIICGIFIKFITDGRLAVLIFFVLSGYALSVGQLNLEKRNLALATASRYFRLMIPILVTSLIAYALLRLNLMFNLEVATTHEKSFEWLGSFYKFDASLKDAIKFSFYDVFFKYDGDKTYNPSLWTMPIEIIGSFMIYAYLGIFRAEENINWKVILPSTMALFIFRPLYSCFLIGYVIAEINKKYDGDYLFSILKTKKVEILFLLIFFISATLSTLFRDNDYVTCLFATFIVISVSFSKNLKSFCSNGLSNYLGRISFPLYLIQIPIICSLSSFLYLKLPTFGFDIVTSNLINLFSTIVISLISATLLLPIEKISVKYSKKIGMFFINS